MQPIYVWMLPCLLLAPARPGQLNFGSCPEGQISSRTNVPSAVQNKQPVNHRCQLTLNFLRIATTTTTSQYDTAHTDTHRGDKVLSYLTINIELKPRNTNTNAHTSTQSGVQISSARQLKTLQQQH